MKPIATVHWLEDGERSKNCYNQDELNTLASALKSVDRVFWVCLMPGGMPPRIRPPEKPVGQLLREKDHQYRFVNITPQ
jgi:hypothetical protein